MRGQLASAFASRGHHRSNLWFVYSPKAGKDTVLRGDLEYGHFLLAESDPDVQRVDYAPAKRVSEMAGEAIGTIVDAEVTLRSGAVVWREIKQSSDVEHGAQGRANIQLMIQLQAAAAVAARHELLTEKEIFSQPQRIHNWLRIVPWLAQARDWPLHDFGNLVASLVQARGSVEYHEVLDLEEGPQRPLLVAALFRAVQFGHIGSDLDTHPLTRRSRFFSPAGRS